MKKLIQAFVVCAVLIVAVAALLPAAASAIDLFPSTTCSGAGANSAACQPDGSDNITGPNGIILRAANLVSIIGGIAAVVGLIIGGFMFVTAGGDSGRISSGKKTIIYSLVGIIIIALARTIVVFVITRV